VIDNAYLIDGHLDACLLDTLQVLRVKVGETDVSKLAFLLELLEGLHGIEIGGITIFPPMELEEIKSRRIHSLSKKNFIQEMARERGQSWLIAMGRR